MARSGDRGPTAGKSGRRHDECVMPKDHGEMPGGEEVVFGRGGSTCPRSMACSQGAPQTCRPGRLKGKKGRHCDSGACGRPAHERTFGPKLQTRAALNPAVFFERDAVSRNFGGITQKTPRRIGLWKGLPTRGAHSYVGKTSKTCWDRSAVDTHGALAMHSPVALRTTDVTADSVENHSAGWRRAHSFLRWQHPQYCPEPFCGTGVPSLPSQFCTLA
jgi:hypothetical protein